MKRRHPVHAASALALNNLASTARAMATVLALSAPLAGCASGATPAPQTVEPAPQAPATPVSDEEFARVVHGLMLSKDSTPESKLRMAGVVQYQLARAERLFDAGYEDAAENTVIGALLLLRKNDAIASATLGQAEALLHAAHEAARVGDTGRSSALYERTLKISDDPQVVADVNAHLEAMNDWLAATKAETSLQRTGEQTRHATSRAVVDPSQEAYQAAMESIVEWMLLALQTSVGEGGPASRLEREQAMEAYRAVRSGAPALMAIAMRQGELGKAWSALDDAELERALPPGVGARLLQATEDDDPEAWLDMFRLFDATRREASAETSLPAYVGDSGAFGAALALYRSSPGQIEHAMPLAMMLVEFGMPEVAANLIAQNTSAQSHREAVSWSVALIINGMMELGRTDQIEAARRTLEEARPLLELAEGRRFRGLSPSPAQVYALLASLETRRGFADRAYPLLEKASKLEPDSAILLRLAKLSRHRGDTDLALQQVDRAIQLAQGHGDLLTEAQAEELSYEIHRDLKHEEEANAALARSLTRTLTARSLELETISLAGVERLLARILAHYGDLRATRRAYERALEASRKNPLELEITLTDMARAALTAGDVRLARLATRTAVDLGLPAEDLVYIALWQQIVERRTNTPSNSLAREVLLEAGSATGWLATLRQFAIGKLDPARLPKIATTVPERTEADFYQAMRQEGAPAQARLTRVANSPAVDLIEVQIAQDLLAPSLKLSMPADVDVP